MMRCGTGSYLSVHSTCSRSGQLLISWAVSFKITFGVGSAAPSCQAFIGSFTAPDYDIDQEAFLDFLESGTCFFLLFD